MENKDNNGNMVSEKSLSFVFRTAAVLCAVSIVLFCFGMTRVDSLVLLFVIFGLSSMLMYISILLFVSGVKTRKLVGKNVNYFLYDKKTKKNMPVSGLTFSEIHKRLVKYMSLFRRGGKLYIGDFFANNSPVPSSFRPLLCYELLHEMSEDGGNVEKAKMFLSFGRDCAQAFYDNLMNAGECELSRDIMNFFESYSSENEVSEEFCRYITDRRDYIENRMVRYTAEHIEEFE